MTIKFKHGKPFLTAISLRRVAPDQSVLYKVIVTFDGITCIIIYNVYYPMPMFKLDRWYGGRHGDAMCAVYMLLLYNHHTQWLAMQFCSDVFQRCDLSYSLQSRPIYYKRSIEDAYHKFKVTPLNRLPPL